MNIFNHHPITIGIDHGYGNIKTANCCFRTGVASFGKEPTFKINLLIYEDRYYLIGEEHKEFTADKMADNDYYILILAAIGRELNIRKQTSARVHLAAGLPLTRRPLTVCYDMGQQRSANGICPPFKQLPGSIWLASSAACGSMSMTQS